jgi:hypothetical protein
VFINCNITGHIEVVGFSGELDWFEMIKQISEKVSGNIILKSYYIFFSSEIPLLRSWYKAFQFVRPLQAN